jgi:hypothetical protein
MKWFFITASSVLAVVAFLFPIACAELVFIFLIVLFYGVIKSNFSVSYKEGFWWGFVFYSLFFSDLFRLIINRGYGLSRFFAILFLLCYSSLCVALWFGLGKKFSTFAHNQSLKLLCWGSITWLYFYWVDAGFFWIFGNWEGNQLNHLTVPLAVRPHWLYFLPFLGKNGFLFILVFFSLSVVMFLTDFSKKKAFVCFCSCLILLSGFVLSKPKKNIPSWVKKIGCVIAYTDEQNPFNIAEHIMFLLDEFKKNHPEVKCIIMPESSFKFPLNIWTQCLRLWKTEDTEDYATLLIGSHRKEGDQLFNTLYQVKKGKIVSYYDKKHGLFFTERIPPFWTYFTGSRTLFLKNHEPFNQGKNNCSTIFIDHIGALSPMICSDLFFTKSNLSGKDSFLCIANDSWFISAYIPFLMFLHAKVIAVLEQQSVLYVSYNYALFIDNEGTEQILPSLKK